MMKASRRSFIRLLAFLVSRRNVGILLDLVFDFFRGTAKRRRGILLGLGFFNLGRRGGVVRMKLA